MRNPIRPHALATLRQFAERAQKPVARERCELCKATLAPHHQHLIEPESRTILCACDACSLLFDVPANRRFRRIPRDSRWLKDFQLADAEWDDLLIPINVAFIFESSAAGKVVAIYPSPAGPTESLLTLDTWQGIVENNPVLRSMTVDVEALLINRLGPRRGFDVPEYYLVPIDECYKLVGLVRSHWRGLSGGEAVWQQISGFFSQLAERSAVVSRR